MTVENGIQVTDRRELALTHVNRTVEWAVNEFNDGDRFMLTAHCAGVQFSAHFTGEQWVEFQALIGQAR